VLEHRLYAGVLLKLVAMDAERLFQKDTVHIFFAAPAEALKTFLRSGRGEVLGPRRAR